LRSLKSAHNMILPLAMMQEWKLVLVISVDVYLLFWTCYYRHV
jgi:hypothetical protein